MDGSLYGILYYAVPLSVFVVLYGILHVEARHRGGSIWRDIGPNGWFVAILIWLATSSFGSAILNGIQVLSGPSPDWVWLTIESLVLAGLGTLFFLGGRNEYFFGTLRAPTPLPLPPMPINKDW